MEGISIFRAKSHLTNIAQNDTAAGTVLIKLHDDAGTIGHIPLRPQDHRHQRARHQ